jgi:O-antigen ligase
VDILSVFKNQWSLYLILIAWMILSSYFSPISFLILPFTFYLINSKKYSEVLVTIFFTLILSDSLQDSLAWAKAFKPILIIFVGLVYMLKYKTFETKNPLIRYFIPFLIVAVFCIGFSPIVATSVQKTLSYFLILLIVPTFILEGYREHGYMILKEIVVFSILIIVLGYLYKYVNYELAVSVGHGGRIRGFFGNPNGLGLYLIVVSVVIAAVRALSPNAISTREYFAFIVIILFVAYVSGSRTALLSIVSLVLTIRVFKFSLWIGLVLFLLIAVSYEYLFSSIISVGIGLGLADDLRLDKVESGSGRLIAWAFAWEEVKKSLFIGKGLGYDVKLMRDNAPILSRLGHEGGVHNTYLIIWLNTGLVGLVMFFRAILLLIIQGSKKSHVSVPIFLAVGISIIFEPWLAASLNPYTSMFLVALTILVSPLIIPQNEEVEEASE